jgi:hypothetical protein
MGFGTFCHYIYKLFVCHYHIYYHWHRFPVTDLEADNIWYVNRLGRLAWGMNCLRPLKHWDRGIESHSRHGCLFAFILCVGRSLATGWSPVQGILPTVYRLRNWTSSQGPRKGCRAVIEWNVWHEPGPLLLCRNYATKYVVRKDTNQLVVKFM